MTNKAESIIKLYRKEVRKIKENNSNFSTREELDHSFKEKIEREGGLNALLSDRQIELIEKFDEFKRANKLAPGELLETMKLFRLFVLSKL